MELTQISRSENHEITAHMETRRPRDISKQSNQSADKNNDMELLDQKHDHLWTARKGTPTQSTTQTGTYMYNHITTTMGPRR